MIAAAWMIAGPVMSQPVSMAVPQRIISLVPAATEMLFAFGAGPRVVGVGSFDRFPAEAQTRAKVGGLLDPDVERILSLRPDLAVVYATQDDLRSQLNRAGIAQFVYRHGGLEEVISTIRDLGARTGRPREANALATDLESRLASLQARVAGRPRPRTLLVFGREPLALRNVFASGGVGFLHEMLVMAGGTNVFGDVSRESVQASTEAILARAPDVIIEVRSRALAQEGDIGRERAAWDRLTSVPAVRTGRIALLTGDEFVVPGPRIADATKRLAIVLHPEAFAK